MDKLYKEIVSNENLNRNYENDFKPWIDSRNDDNKEAYLSELEGIRKYLFASNAGGAAATLAFIGAANVQGAVIPLLFFLFGLITVGVYLAVAFHHVEHSIEKFNQSLSGFYKNEVPFTDVVNASSVENPWYLYLLPYLSFGSFILGCLVAACYFYHAPLT